MRKLETYEWDIRGGKLSLEDGTEVFVMPGDLLKGYETRRGIVFVEIETPTKH
jgi:hypothetical protein